MNVGAGWKVHLRDGELPMGRLVVNVSRHSVAVIDGVINDTFDDQHGGTRCVYGYWKLRLGWYYDDLRRPPTSAPSCSPGSSRPEGADDHPPLLATGAAMA
jgi:hypothetical protein